MASVSHGYKVYKNFKLELEAEAEILRGSGFRGGGTVLFNRTSLYHHLNYHKGQVCNNESS
jgi:hypothetical protein